MALQHQTNPTTRFPKTKKLVDSLPKNWQGPTTPANVKESLVEITEALHDAIELLLNLQMQISQNIGPKK